MPVTESSLTLTSGETMTTKNVFYRDDGTITVWPCYGPHSLRLNGSPEQLTALRTLLDEALANIPAPVSPTYEETDPKLDVA